MNKKKGILLLLVSVFILIISCSFKARAETQIYDYYQGVDSWLSNSTSYAPDGGSFSGTPNPPRNGMRTLPDQSKTSDWDNFYDIGRYWCWFNNGSPQAATVQEDDNNWEIPHGLRCYLDDPNQHGQKYRDPSGIYNDYIAYYYVFYRRPKPKYISAQVNDAFYDGNCYWTKTGTPFTVFNKFYDPEGGNIKRSFLKIMGSGIIDYGWHNFNNTINISQASSHDPYATFTYGHDWEWDRSGDKAKFCLKINKNDASVNLYSSAQNGNGTCWHDGNNNSNTSCSSTLMEWINNNIIVKTDGEAPTYSSIETANKTNSGYDVYVYNVKDIRSGVQTVRFPTWTKPDQSDIKWLQGKNVGNGTWMVHVNKNDFNGAMTGYNTHIYLYDNVDNREGYVAVQNIDLKRPNLTVQNQIVNLNNDQQPKNFLLKGSKYRIKSVVSNNGEWQCGNSTLGVYYGTDLSGQVVAYENTPALQPGETCTIYTTFTATLSGRYESFADCYNSIDESNKNDNKAYSSAKVIDPIPSNGDLRVMQYDYKQDDNNYWVRPNSNFNVYTDGYFPSDYGIYPTINYLTFAKDGNLNNESSVHSATIGENSINSNNYFNNHGENAYRKIGNILSRQASTTIKNENNNFNNNYFYTDNDGYSGTLIKSGSSIPAYSYIIIPSSQTNFIMFSRIELKNLTPTGYDVYAYDVICNRNPKGDVFFPSWKLGKNGEQIGLTWYKGINCGGNNYMYHVSVNDDHGEYITDGYTVSTETKDVNYFDSIGRYKVQYNYRQTYAGTIYKSNNYLCSNHVLSARNDGDKFKLFYKSAFMDSDDGTEYASPYTDSGKWIRVDGKAPTGVLNTNLDSNLHLSISATQVSDNGGSGVRNLYAVVTDPKTGRSTTVNLHKDRDTFEGEEWSANSIDAYLFKSSKLKIDLYGTDNVGNTGEIGSNTVSLLTISAKIAPNPDLQGHNACIAVTTTGYADTIKAYWPQEIMSQDKAGTVFPMTKQIKQEPMHNDSFTYLLPLTTPLTMNENGKLRDPYTIVVEADNKDNGDKAQTTVQLDVEDNVLDGVKTEIIGTGYDRDSK